MPSKSEPPSTVVALLSTASIAENPGAAEGSAFTDIAGRSILEWQILALQQANVRQFLIEVDNVPGALLDLADTLRRQGSAVEFVRSIKDVQDLLPAQTSLVIVAEAHHFSSGFVAEMMAAKTPSIATLDSREENAAFERIDLNTRWAGWATVQSTMVQSIGELPEGWSIGSSLLRHAVQNGVLFVPVAQSRLQQADVMRMDSRADTVAFADSILRARAIRPSGFIERRIFGPIGKYVAPLIWRNGSARPLMQLAAPAAGLASLGLSVLGWIIAAAALALAAMMFSRVFEIISGDNDYPQRMRWLKPLFWVLLTLSALTAAWQAAEQPTNALWFTTVAVAVAYYSARITLPAWSASMLKSPALLAVGLLIGAVFSTVELSAKIIALFQLALLIGGQHLPRKNAKNSIHA
jgi:hypothetical protein